MDGLFRLCARELCPIHLGHMVVADNNRWGITDNRLEGLQRVVGILKNPLVCFRGQRSLYLVEAIDLVIDYQNRVLLLAIVELSGAFGSTEWE